MMRVRLMTRCAAVLMVGGLALGVGACSSDTKDDSAAATTTTPAAGTCEAWATTSAAFKSFDQIDVVNDGLSSVRGYLDDLDAAVKELDTSATAEFKPLVEDLKTSLEGLKTGVTSGTVVMGGLGDQLTEVDTSWNALVSAMQKECPDVTADTAGM